MFLQNVPDAFSLKWNKDTTYGDIHREGEKEGSTYNFEHVDSKITAELFDIYEKESTRLIKEGLLLPGYEYMLKSSHIFNTLDASGAISVSERAAYIARVRELAKASANLYIERNELSKNES